MAETDSVSVARTCRVPFHAECERDDFQHRSHGEHRNGRIPVKPNWEFVRKLGRKERTPQLAEMFDGLTGEVSGL